MNVRKLFNVPKEDAATYHWCSLSALYSIMLRTTRDLKNLTDFKQLLSMHLHYNRSPEKQERNAKAAPPEMWDYR